MLVYLVQFEGSSFPKLFTSRKHALNYIAENFTEYLLDSLVDSSVEEMESNEENFRNYLNSYTIETRVVDPAKPIFLLFDNNQFSIEPVVTQDKSERVGSVFIVRNGKIEPDH